MRTLSVQRATAHRRRSSSQCSLKIGITCAKTSSCKSCSGSPDSRFPTGWPAIADQARAHLTQSRMRGAVRTLCSEGVGRHDMAESESMLPSTLHLTKPLTAASPDWLHSKPELSGMSTVQQTAGKALRASSTSRPTRAPDAAASADAAKREHCKTCPEVNQQ